MWIFKNYGSGFLAGSVSEASETLSLKNNAAALFSGDSRPFRAVLWDKTKFSAIEDPNREIIECTYLNDSTLTIESRGLEGTAIKEWVEDDRFTHIVTAEQIEQQFPYEGPTPPPNPIVGRLWIDTSGD